MNNVLVYGIASSRSTRVLWALEEANQNYEFVSVDMRSGEHLSESYKTLNPGSKVPVLKHGDFVVTESGAIVNYVAREFAPHLIPTTNNLALASYERWCLFALTELEQPLWTMGKHKFALPAEHRVTEIFPTAQWEHQQALRLFSQGLSDKPFILGDDFSGADILLGHTLFWGLAFKQPLEQQNLIDYVQRLKGRSALQRAAQKEGREI